MIYYQKREPVYMYVHCTPHSVQTKTCSGITHNSRAGAHNIPKPKPLSILPINASRVISYSTLTMTFVTTFNCNTVDNLYIKKHVSLWDPRMCIANIYVKNMQASGIPEWAQLPCKQIWF